MTNETTDSAFRGKRKTAVTRLRRLTKLACEHLPTETLNRASFHLAAYIDAATGRRNLANRVSEELRDEQTKASRATRPAGLTRADRELLRQLGIKG